MARICPFTAAALATAVAIYPVRAQTVRVTEEPQVSQPAPFSSGGRTVVVPRTRIDVDEGSGPKAPMPKPAPRPPVAAAPAPPPAATPESAGEGAVIDGVFVGQGEPKVVVLPDRITEPRLVAALKAHGFSTEETAAIVARARASGKVSAR
jgi:hypothetical protein